MKKPIVLMQPYVTDEMRAAAAEVLTTRWIGQGPRVDDFERKFQEMVCDSEDVACVAVSSGTAALHLAYILAGIGPGSTVAAPLFTCTATNEPLLWLGARIRFIDVEPGGLNMDRHQLRQAIAQEKIDAAVVVHYGGQPARAAYHDYNIPVIEDCAQSLGATDPDSQRASSPLKAYSFQAVKAVTTCDGGMLVCPPWQRAKAKRLRWFGIDREAKLAGTWANDIVEVGYKYQMTDDHAAMGIASLDRLSEQTWVRRELRNIYVAGLRSVRGIRVIDQDAESACWLMTVVVENRDGLMRKLRENKIECDQVHYRNDRYSIFAPFRPTAEQCQNMNWMDTRYLCLPLHMGLGPGDVEYICEVIKSGW